MKLKIKTIEQLTLDERLEAAGIEKTWGNYVEYKCGEHSFCDNFLSGVLSNGMGIDNSFGGDVIELE